MGATKDDVLGFIMEEIGHAPEYLWMKFPGYAIFRNPQNRKWYAALMEVERNNLGLNGEGMLDILDVKCSHEKVEELKSLKGFLPTYHMNKKSWITILLDGSVEKQKVFKLIEESLGFSKKGSK